MVTVKSLYFVGVQFPWYSWVTFDNEFTSSMDYDGTVNDYITRSKPVYVPRM